MATERAWLDLGLRDVAASARLFWNAAALWGAGGENREEGEAQGSPCSAVGSLHHSEASLWGQFTQSAPDSPLAVNAHAPGSRDTHPSWALLKKSTPGPAMTPAFRLASASRCSQRLGCRRPAVGETLTTSECLAPPRPKVCRSGLLGASVLDMVARPPLNLAMVAGSRVGELGSGPWEIGDGTPWRSVARPGWSCRRPGSSSFRVSEVLSNHGNSLPPLLLLKRSLRQCWGPSHRGLGLCPLPGPLRKEPLLSPTLRQLLVQTSPTRRLACLEQMSVG